jgi:phytoene dehydrogenase-like protein
VPKYDAIVIGAGPNGLTAAAMLAKGGRKVLVVESAAEIGGHTRAIEFAPGFRSPLEEDCGWIPPAVRKSLALDSIRQVARTISMSVAIADGTIVPLHARPDKVAGDLLKLTPRDIARWPGFVARLHRFAGILGDLYGLTPPDIDTRSVGEVLPLLGVGRRLRGLGREDMIEFLRIMPMSVQDLVDDTFDSEPLKAAVAACAIRDLQQGPRSAGTTFNFLHYMVGAPEGSVRARNWFFDGPDAFAKAAADSARGAGAEIRTRAPVRRIDIREGAVAGVVLDNGEEIEARVVLSTADPKRTMLKLVDPVWLDPELVLAVRNVKLRGCTAYVLFALDRGLNGDDRTSIATVSLTSDTTRLEQAADAAKYGEISASPHVEFFSPTLRWPGLAPAGKHVVAARVQYAPYNLKVGSWDDATATALKEQVTAAIARVVPGFEASIIHRVALTPRDVEERFGVTEGAITQGEMTLDQILFMRPVPGWGRYAMPIAGLYLAGSGAHPGPGVLGGAGFLAARTALRVRISKSK